MYPQIIEEIIPKGRPNRPGKIISPEFITIHSTGNRKKNADALRHSYFLKKMGFYAINGKKIYVSWHFTIDDKNIVQHLPLDEIGYHAGKGNSRSVGVEICMNEGMNMTIAIENAVWLVAMLLKKCGLRDKKVYDSVVPHYFWTGKNCPEILLDNKKPGELWKQFIDAIENELKL